MVDIESKIISCREDANDFRLCLTREEIDEIKQALNKKSWLEEVRGLLQERTKVIDEILEYLRNEITNIPISLERDGYRLAISDLVKLKEQNK